MSWMSISIAAIVAVYVGTSIGLYSICVETPRLHKAKKYVLYIPGFTLICVFFCLLCRDKEYRRVAVGFLKLPHKQIIMLSFFADVVAAEKEKQPKKQPKKRAVFSGVMDVFRGMSYRNPVALA